MQTRTVPAPEAEDFEGTLAAYCSGIFELYKDLICRGEISASRGLFTSAWHAADSVCAARTAGCEAAARAARENGRRAVQEGLYWLWLLEARGMLPRPERYDRLTDLAIQVWNGLTEKTRAP